MKDGVKLISKPSKPNLCALICAANRGEMTELSKYCNYIVENENGIRFEIYARNDKAFHEKMVKIRRKHILSPTNPTIF